MLSGCTRRPTMDSRLKETEEQRSRGSWTSDDVFYISRVVAATGKPNTNSYNPSNLMFMITICYRKQSQRGLEKDSTKLTLSPPPPSPPPSSSPLSFFLSPSIML